jgi:hypothetical protein
MQRAEPKNHAELESRIPGNRYVRFGGGVTETWMGNRLRRWVPTQHYVYSHDAGMALFGSDSESLFPHGSRMEGAQAAVMSS